MSKPAKLSEIKNLVKAGLVIYTMVLLGQIAIISLPWLILWLLIMEELIGAIRKVYTKGRYISTVLAEHLAFDIKPDSETSAHEKLSNREHQIMCMLASGKKVKEIAEELSLSVSSIFTFRTRIFEKLDVRSNVDLTHYAINNKLID